MARGAVLCGMGMGPNNAALAIPCERYYGICGSEIISGSSRHPDDRVYPVSDEIHDKSIAMNRVSWLIRKGDVVLLNKPAEATTEVTFTFREGHLSNGSTGRILFVTSGQDTPPPLNMPAVSEQPGSCTSSYHSSSSLTLAPLGDTGVSSAAIHFSLTQIPHRARQHKRSYGGAEYIEAKVNLTLKVYHDNRVDVSLVSQGIWLGGFQSPLSTA